MKYKKWLMFIVTSIIVSLFSPLAFILAGMKLYEIASDVYGDTDIITIEKEVTT